MKRALLLLLVTACEGFDPTAPCVEGGGGAGGDSVACAPGGLGGAGDEPGASCDPALDAACGTDCRGGWPAAWVAMEERVLVLVNEQRARGATCGADRFAPAGPLRMDAALRQAARCHSADMAARGFFDHDTPDGVSPWDRIAAAGYTGSATGENIAAGYPDPDAVVRGWVESPGHCSNLMAPGSNEHGIGFQLAPGTEWTHYWTQTFGAR